MSISSALVAAQGKVADCYTAISGKGGTLPVTQNLANMPTAINSIPSGGGGSSKYGCTVDNLLGDVDGSGVLQPPVAPSSIVFSGVKDVSSYLLNRMFYRKNSYYTDVSFPDLENISGTQAMVEMFYYTPITSISFPKLKTISGSNGASYAFCGSNITSASFPELTTISGYAGMGNFIGYCTQLETVSLPKLQEVSGTYGLQALVASSKISTMSFPMLSVISGSNCLSQLFYACKEITSISFTALTTTSFGSYINQFVGMFNSSSGSTSGAITMHFPSNLETTIQGLTGYPNFGATAGVLTLAFDLPATS